MQQRIGGILEELITAKRLRPIAQGCFNPGNKPVLFDNPERVATIDATPIHRGWVAKRAIPRVEATLGYGAQPLRGKAQKSNVPESSTAQSLQASQPLDQLRQRSSPDELPEADQKDSSLLLTQPTQATLHIQNHEGQRAYDE